MRKNLSDALLTLCCLSTTLTAQTTWIVDVAAGPGADFTDMPTAIATASGGDTLLVRSGTYTSDCLVVDKPLSILGLADDVVLHCATFQLFSPGMLVRDIPVGQSFVLSRVRLAGNLYNPQLEARFCEGAVLLDTVRNVSPSPSGVAGLQLAFHTCAQVHVHATTASSAGTMTFTNSRGVVTDTTFSQFVATAVTAEDSELTFDGLTLDQSGVIIGLGSPMVLDGGTTRLARCNIVAAATPVITALNQPTILVDPTTTLAPGAGQGTVNGTATVLNGELVTTGRGGSPITPLIELLGHTGALHATFVSFAGNATPSPFGDLWIDPAPGANVLVAVGVFATREASILVPNFGLPAGVVLSMQSLVLDGGLTFGNGVFYLTP